MTLIQVAHPARTIFSRTECQNALLETNMLRTFRKQTQPYGSPDINI